jgi:hypothetical protein
LIGRLTISYAGDDEPHVITIKQRGDLPSPLAVLRERARLWVLELLFRAHRRKLGGQTHWIRWVSIGGIAEKMEAVRYLEATHE